MVIRSLCGSRRDHGAGSGLRVSSEEKHVTMETELVSEPDL